MINHFIYFWIHRKKDSVAIFQYFIPIGDQNCSLEKPLIDYFLCNDFKKKMKVILLDNDEVWCLAKNNFDLPKYVVYFSLNL